MLNNRQLRQLEEQGMHRIEAENTRFYSLEEAGEEVGLSIEELEELIENEEFGAFEIDGELYTTSHCIDYYLKQMEEAGDDESEADYDDEEETFISAAVCSGMKRPLTLSAIRVVRNYMIT
ncbi:MAG: hypothetical protein LUH47_03795 [Clostridiales bacterium]|nr:hypothetical protein [Clostridiales bacterium]